MYFNLFGTNEKKTVTTKEDKTKTTTTTTKNLGPKTTITVKSSPLDSGKDAGLKVQTELEAAK
tara:strand:+ start:743 stop:931 length:189 start_codon:yes stop_codon:yes gene_type:complete